MTFKDWDNWRRLKAPGTFKIEMILLRKGDALDYNFENMDARTAVLLSKFLFETGHFDYVRVFGQDGSKVINYESAEFVHRT